MTVAELIEELKLMPQNADVETPTDDGSGHEVIGATLNSAISGIDGSDIHTVTIV